MISAYHFCDYWRSYRVVNHLSEGEISQEIFIGNIQFTLQRETSQSEMYFQPLL